MSKPESDKADLAHVDRALRRPASSTLSATERRQRAEAVNFARASVGLEGFTLSQEDEEQAQRFINGEIELAEFVELANSLKR